MNLAVRLGVERSYAAYARTPGSSIAVVGTRCLPELMAVISIGSPEESF
jgi:hypothetical protein